MNKTSIFRTSLLAPVILSIAACGGGGGGGTGGGTGDGPRSPVQGVEMATIQSKTGISSDQPKVMANAAAMVNDVNGHSDMRLVVREFQHSGDSSPPDAAIYVQVDQNGDGTYDEREVDWVSAQNNLNPDGDPISAETGAPIVSSRTISRGGADLVMAEHVPDFQSRTTVYVPANEASDMYGGMYVYSRDGGEYYSYADGAVATWGRKTSASDFRSVVNDAELSGQVGGATYSGVAEAIVSGAGNNESGRYRDLNASGTVNFENNTVTTRANLANIEEAGTGQSMRVSTTGTFNNDGTINQGGAQVSGLSTGGMSGTSTGEFYGPDADTLGVVFAGQGDGGATSVVGGMLLNRSDDPGQ